MIRNGCETIKSISCWLSLWMVDGQKGDDCATQQLTKRNKKGNPTERPTTLCALRALSLSPSALCSFWNIPLTDGSAWDYFRIEFEEI